MVKKIKYLSLVLVGLMFLVMGQPAIAAEEAEKIVTPQSYDYMSLSYCEIKSSDSTAAVTGITKAKSNVDKIVTTVYLEKETSSGWTTVDSWTETVYNTSYCKSSGSKSVSPGNYRAHCVHKVYEGSIVEVNYSDSSKTYIN